MNSADSYNPLPKHILYFQQLAEDPRKLSIPETTQENLEPILPLCSLNIRNKNMKSWTHPASPSLNESTIYPHTIKALKTTKITKLGLGLLPPPPAFCFQQKVHNIRIEKQIHIHPSQEMISDHWISSLIY